jgi:hypothetical protein
MTKTLEPIDILREFEQHDVQTRVLLRRKYKLSEIEMNCAADICGQAIARIRIPEPTVPGMSQIDFDIAVSRFVQITEEGIADSELSDLGVPLGYVDGVSSVALSFVDWLSNLSREVFPKYGISTKREGNESIEGSSTYRCLEAAVAMHLEYRKLKKRVNDKYGEETAACAIQMEAAEKQLKHLRQRWKELKKEYIANA